MRHEHPDRPGSATRATGLGDVVYQRATETPRVGLLSRRTPAGQWEQVSASEFLGEVSAVAKGLIAAGVSAGDRVVLVMGNRYEWALVAFAVWMVRAVLVPLPPLCSAPRLRHVLRDCHPAAVVLQDGRHQPTVAGIGHELTDLARVWRLDDTGLETVTRPGSFMDSTAVRFRREEASRDDPATIVYPMGTRVRPRGAVLTHANLLDAGEAMAAQLNGALRREEAGGSRTLTQVPMADITGQAALVACVLAGVRVGLCASQRELLAELPEFQPTVLVATPHLLERIYLREKARMRESGWDSLNSFDAATELAMEFDRAERKGAWRRVSRAMYDWVYARLREALGGRVRFIVCVGVGLEEWVDRFYGGVGIPVFATFGTVETAGAFTANAPGQRRVGTVGQPLPGVQVRLSRDGEVHVRGPGVFPGYYADAEATRAAFRDGWLATGFRGEVDADGYVVVGDRLRPQATLLARSRETAPPAGEPDHVRVLEQRLCEHPLVSQAVVITERRPFPSALITLTGDQLEYWRLVNARPLTVPPQELTSDPQLVAEVQAAVQHANAAVPAGAAVRAFHVLAEEFTPQSGLVLPSGEVRRAEVLRAFAEEIDGLYRDPPTGGGA